jgi:hypothetical protein
LPSSNIPILLIAYCRPIEFSRIAADIELLSPRRIEISIDGPSPGLELENRSVVDLALKWKSSSRHEITIWHAESNLGLFGHFSLALDRFFTKTEWGLVLEDDLEFREEFVEFLDSSQARELLNKYFSICGHNPLSDLSSYKGKEPINFQETNIHTISGWAASSGSVFSFLKLLKESRYDSNHLSLIIKDFSKAITKDNLLARSLFNNWCGKMIRAVNSPRPNWDNYWELAAWDSGKPSLRPTFSLTRENPISFGKQTHQHNFDLKIWPKGLKNLRLEARNIVSLKRGSEIKALRIWGTSRRRAYKEFVNEVLRRT